MKANDMKIGSPPVILGTYEQTQLEMMYYLYLPIKLNDSAQMAIPKRLRKYQPIIDCIADSMEGKYVYISAKTCHVVEGVPQNRGGWHIDGYASNGDINVVWANSCPTEFAHQDFNLSDDDSKSLQEMEEQVLHGHIITYPNNTILRLDESVVHRASEDIKAGIRSFVKISISEHKFIGEGNSINHELDYDWDYQARGVERNLDHGR